FSVLDLTLLGNQDVCMSWDLTKQQFLGEFVFQHVLYRTAKRTCTHGGVVAAFCQQFLGCLIQFDAQVLFFQTFLEATDKQVNNLDDFWQGQLWEDDDVIHTVQELWAEVLTQLLLDSCLHPFIAGLGIRNRLETSLDTTSNVESTQVGRHNDDRVLEVHDTTLRVGQAAFFKNL